MILNCLLMEINFALFAFFLFIIFLFCFKNHSTCIHASHRISEEGKKHFPQSFCSCPQTFYSLYIPSFLFLFSPVILRTKGMVMKKLFDSTIYVTNIRFSFWLGLAAQFCNSIKSQENFIWEKLMIWNQEATPA